MYAWITGEGEARKQSLSTPNVSDDGYLRRRSRFAFVQLLFDELLELKAAASAVLGPTVYIQRGEEEGSEEIM